MSVRVTSQISAAVLIAVFAACADGHRTVAPTTAPSPVVQISGHVYDTLRHSVADTRVEVLDGPSAGAATVTGATGDFTLSASLTTASRLRATKAGYESAVVPFLAAPITVYITAIGTVNLEGQYTLTIEADPDCADLPLEARKRTYDAIVPGRSSTAPWQLARIAGPSLDNYFHNVLLVAGGDTVQFDLSDNGIVDEIEDETYFAIGGYGTATGATDFSASARFGGLIDYCEVKPGSTSFWPCAGDVVNRQSCQSSNHRLTLTKQ